MTSIAPEKPAPSESDVVRMQERLRKLAEEKSTLQLIISLTEQLNPLPGISEMVDSMLKNIIKTIGGTNIQIWYWVDKELHAVELNGKNEIVTGIDDPIAAQVVKSRSFIEVCGSPADSLLYGDVIPEAWTWGFPLLVGKELIGVVKIKNIHMSGEAMRKYLPFFFRHLALILANEIRAYQRMIAEKEVNDERILLKSLLNGLPDLVWLKDQYGVYLACNPQFENFFGANEATIVGKTDYDFVERDLADFFRQNDMRAMRAKLPCINEEWLTFASDGHKILAETTKSPLCNAAGDLVGVLGIAHDITKRKQVETSLKLAASVFTHAKEGIMITDADGMIVDVNTTFTDITGYQRKEILGQNPRIFKSGMQSDDFYQKMWRTLIETGHWSGEVWNRRKNGEVYAQVLTVSAVRDTDGNTQNYVALFADITTQKEHQVQLEHIAHYDSLTNLPNRILLADRLQQAIAQSQRRGYSLAVVYLDLDGFKLVNDRYGHDMGDELLITITERLKLALREYDTLARIGGDEFVAVLVDFEKQQDCEAILDRLLLAASNPVTVKGQIMQVSASIGVTLFPYDGVDADLLLRHADQAMYLAKQAGKNRYHLFDVNQDAAVKAQRENIDQIRHGLQHGEFLLYYQPKVNMRTGVVIGAEALIRWQHPRNGLLPPAAFLPMIDDTPLSLDLDDWVISTALAQIAEWHAAGICLPISVNIGAAQLQQGNFTSRLRMLLAAHPDIPPSLLELEILETSALQDVGKVSELIHDCRQIGIRFALDDFGTGYSSLTYLKRLPAEQLKIDQTFVRDILEDDDDVAIIKGVVGLAHAFRREVIAEGVETVEHGEKLLTLGCELAQGYGVARPMPASEFPGWALAWKTHARWAQSLENPS